MIEAVRQWILGITGTSIVAGIAMSVTPEGRVKKAVKLVSGLAVMLALISPVLSFDFEGYSQYMSEYRQEAEKYASALDGENEKLTRTIIEEKTEAYILDKGAELGISGLTVSVTAKWGDEDCWYPYSARLMGETDEKQMQALSGYMESELGITEENQTWSVRDGS